MGVGELDKRCGCGAMREEPGSGVSQGSGGAGVSLDERTFRLHLDRDARAPGQARRALSDWLAPFGCGRDVEEALMVVISELVTNAVVHAGSASEVRATFGDGRLLLEVYDTDPAPPVPRTLGGGDGDGVVEGGSGLGLVTALATRWGWEETETGKRVWAETRC